MTFTTKETALIALVAALNVVIGSVFYLAGNLLPVPGNKFLLFGPFLGFMMYVLLRTVPKRGTIFAASTVFSVLMLPFHFFMGMAIVGTGITTELGNLLLFRRFDSDRKIRWGAALYPAMAFVWAFFVSVYLTGNLVFLLVGNWWVFSLLVLSIYLLGGLGAWLASRFVYERILGKSRPL